MSFTKATNRLSSFFVYSLIDPGLLQSELLILPETIDLKKSKNKYIVFQTDAQCVNVNVAYESEVTEQ